MSRTIPAGLQTLMNSGVTTLCFCWLIARQDGIKLAFTDCNIDVAFGGNTYLHSTSFTGSAMESQLNLAVSNLDILGALSDDTITENDLECGRYDEANLTIYLVNWKNPSTDFVAIMSGTLGQVTIGDLAYTAELRSRAQAYAQYVGSLCQGNCRVPKLGDGGSGLEGGCQFVLPAPVNATVVSVTDRRNFTVTAAGSFPAGTKGSLTGGYFAEGYVTFTSGANKEVSREILASSGASSPVLIQTKMPFPDDVEIYDACTLQIGCDKTLPVCRKNYNQVVNFRGEPFVPGTDAVFRVHGT